MFFPTLRSYTSPVTTCDQISLPQRTECVRCVHLISCRRRARQCAETGPADQKNEERFCQRKRQSHVLLLLGSVHPATECCSLFPHSSSAECLRLKSLSSQHTTNVQWSRRQHYSPVCLWWHERSRVWDPAEGGARLEFWVSWVHSHLYLWLSTCDHFVIF